MTEPDKSNDLKDWNAMIYLAGENNLAEECIFALKQMKRARPHRRSKNIDNRVKVVAQLDAGGLGGNEVRYLLKQHSDDDVRDANKEETANEDHDGLLHKNELMKVDTTQTFYQGVLKDFVSSSIKKGGLAKHYLIVLSGHGNGIISDFLSRDVETPDKLSIPKIQWVLEEVKQDLMEEFSKVIDENFKFDILGLDSCMMSMAEIGYELRNYVNYMVGAEGFEPNAGWPYERILSDILNQPSILPRDLAIRMVERYVRYYKDFLPAGRSVDQSACDLSMCEPLAKAVKELANVLHEKVSDPETMRHIVLAHWEAQSYKDDQYVDLYDFCDLLDQGSSSKENSATGSVIMRDLVVAERIKTECKNVKKILTGNGKNGGNSDSAERMVLKSCHSGPAVQYSHGLSVYFPWSHVIDSYKDLDFAKDTDWLKFLTKYTEETRRHKRPCRPADPKVPLVKGQLFFNTVAAGFDFLLTENKNTPTINKVLSNKVGSMKNPPIDHVPCDCPLTKPDKENGKSVEPEDPKWVKETPTTETSEPKAEPVVEPKVESPAEPKAEPIEQPVPRRTARKK